MTKAITTKTATTKQAVEVLPANPADLIVEVSAQDNLRLIVATPQVRANAEAKVAAQYGEVLLAQHRTNKSAEKMAEVYAKLRRMYPATAEVQAILGEDAIDLIGASADYKSAVKRMNETSRDLLINAARKEGLTIKGATTFADTELDKFRKSVSRSYRIAVDEFARKAFGPVEGARFLLAHGFKKHGEVRGGLIAEGMSLGEGNVLVLPDTLKISENGKEILPVNLQAAPVEQTDQVKPGETAEAEIKAAAAAVDETLTNPASRINFAIGEVRTAIGDARLPEMDSNESRGHLTNLLLVVGEAVRAIGPNLTAADRKVVLGKLQAMGATAVIGMELATK